MSTGSKSTWTGGWVNRPVKMFPAQGRLNAWGAAGRLTSRMRPADKTIPIRGQVI